MCGDGEVGRSLREKQAKEFLSQYKKKQTKVVLSWGISTW